MVSKWLGIFILFFLFACDDQRPSEDVFKKRTHLKKKTEKKRVETLPEGFITYKNVNERLKEEFKKNESNLILVKTTFGNIQLELFDDTPLHSGSFGHLIRRNYFDSTTFHRVVDGFMIQGGNAMDQDLGQRMKEIGSYYIPDEISRAHLPVTGALAMAVESQEELAPSQRHKNSSPYNFFIIQGSPQSEKRVLRYGEFYEKHYSKNAIDQYVSKGGAPHIQGDFTVFGRVVSGMSIVDKIARVSTDSDQEPLENIYLSIEFVKE